MNVRLKTKKSVELKLIELQSLLQFSSKASVMRSAIGCSMVQKGDPRLKGDNLEHYDIKDQDGADYLRLTILGQDDSIYKVIVQQLLKEKISDEIFFPEMINAHLERGVYLLYNQFRYSNNKEKLFSDLININKKIG